MGQLVQSITNAGGEVRFAQSGDGVQAWVRLADGRTFSWAAPTPDEALAAAWRQSQEQPASP